MGQDVFGAQSDIGGAITFNNALISFTGGDDALVQSVTFNYSRQIQMISPINKNKKYLLVGRGQGTLTIQNLMGMGAPPVPSAACAGGGLTITIHPPDCSGGVENSFVISGAVISGVAGQASDNGGLPMFNGTWSYFFTGLAT